MRVIRMQWTVELQQGKLLQGDSKSNQPGGGTAPSQIGLIFYVLIGSCMITKKTQFFFVSTSLHD